MSYLGTKPGNSTVISDGSVTTAKIADGAITRAKMGYAGAVLQVVNATANSTTSTTSTSFVTTNLSASITPISSTSKILAIWTSTVATANSSTSIPVTLYRGATNLGGTGAITDFVTSGNNWAMNFSYLDSPATTSSTTYTVYFRSGNGSAVYVNITGYTSSLTLVEIAG